MTEQSRGDVNLPSHLEGGQSRDDFRELTRLRTQLVQRELELTNLRSEIQAFEARYYRAIGGLQAELSSLLARIAAARARFHTSDTDLKREAAQAHQRAQEWADATSRAKEHPGPPNQAPEGLKALFRRVARAIHPDLATDPSEIEMREQLMREANAAYERGDIDALQEILDRWIARGHVPLTAIDSKIIERVIDRVRDRLRKIENEIFQLKATSVYKLMQRVGEAEKNGLSLLEEMRASIREQITEARTVILDLERGGAP